MACKITKSLNGKNCEYAVAGASKMYAANWYPPIEGEAKTANVIAYSKDTDGYIDGIFLPGEEEWYEIKSEDNTLSFSDALLVGGNGSKYRQHTVNGVLNQYDIDVLNEGDALSLGRFVYAVVDKAGVTRILGRTGGLGAPAGGFDYNSGAGEADAMGWTLIQQGSSMEIAPIVKDATVLTPIYVDPDVGP